MKTNTGTTDTLELPTDTGEPTTTEISRGTDKPKRVVAVINKRPITYPELWSNVWVVGPERNIGFPQMLARSRCSRAESVEQADIVFFSGGGADVDPALYGEEAHYSTHTHKGIMKEYLEVYQKCLLSGTPMVGVCLGAQFLHVMNGGKLYQDIDNHNRDHPIWIVNEEYSITVTPSVHHQSMYPNPEAVVIATADESTSRIRPDSRLEKHTDREDFLTEDWEACAYPETGCYCFQGHPEYQDYSEYTIWFLNELISNIIENPDFETKDGRIRLRKDVREQRAYELPETVVNYIKENT